MDQDPRPEHKVGIYDRPASADRPIAKWIVWIVAIVISVGWAVYFFVYR